MEPPRKLLIGNKWYSVEVAEMLFEKRFIARHKRKESLSLSRQVMGAKPRGTSR